MYCSFLFISELYSSADRDELNFSRKKEDCVVISIERARNTGNDYGNELSGKAERPSVVVRQEDVSHNSIVEVLTRM